MARRLSPVAALAVVTVAGLMVANGPVAYADVVSYNPFAVNQGFTIVAQGDAALGNGELEGSVAAFGTIQSLKQNYPIVHNVAGEPDYQVPLIDGTPVRLLAGQFVNDPGRGETGFAITNADQSGTTDPASNERTASAELVDVTGLSGSSRGSNFLRVTNATGGILDLEAVAYSPSAVDALKTAESSVAAYFGDVDGQIEDTNECLTSMYDDDTLANEVTVRDAGNQVFVSGFSTTEPNWLDYSAIAGKTIKMDDAGGYEPTAQAPLVIRAPAGTTEINALQFEGWDANSGADQSFARYIMLDLAQVTGTVEIDGLTMSAIWAPHASLYFNSGVTTNGQWFAQDITTGVQVGGEIHHHAFGGELRCGADTPTTTTDTSTSDTSTSDTSTSDTSTSDTSTSDTSTSDTSTSDTSTSETSTSDTSTSDTSTSDTSTWDTSSPVTSSSSTTTADTSTATGSTSASTGTTGGSSSSVATTSSDSHSVEATGTSSALVTTWATGGGGSGGGSLANTGFDVTRWLTGGMILVAAGFGLTVLRRQPKQH
jgi:hypothetical protein